MIKPRRKHSKRSRAEAAYFRTVPGTSSLGVIFDPETGEVSPCMEIETAHTGVSYARSSNLKSDKILNRVFSLNGRPLIESDKAFNLFGSRAAIDTNTVDVDGRRRSVTGIVVSDLKYCGVPYCIEFSDLPAGTEEKIGWIVAIGQLLKDEILDVKTATLIVVDAHLSELEGINRREKPIFDDIFLPAGWVMSYASSDVGFEFQINRFFREADRVSTLVASHLRAINTPLCQAPGTDLLRAPKRIISMRNGWPVKQRISGKCAD